MLLDARHRSLGSTAAQHLHSQAYRLFMPHQQSINKPSAWQLEFPVQIFSTFSHPRRMVVTGARAADPVAY